MNESEETPGEWRKQTAKSPIENGERSLAA